MLRLGYVRSESATIIVEEPEIEAEKTSEKEDTTSSEGSTGILGTYLHICSETVPSNVCNSMC